MIGKKKQKKGSSSFSLKKIESIFQMLQKHQITEFEWSNAAESLKLKTSRFDSQTEMTSFQGPFFQRAASALPSSFPLEEPSLPFKKESSLSLSQGLEVVNKVVTAPLVGTFYNAPSPKAEPFVKVGQVVKPGDVLCIIEAMKLMNEIESECVGKIVSVCVENGQPIEYGESLFIIEPLSE